MTESHLRESRLPVGWRTSLYVNEQGSVVGDYGAPHIEVVEVMPVSEHEEALQITDERVERAARVFYEQDDPGGWDDLDYESKESRLCAAEAALKAALADPGQKRVSE